MNNLLAFSLQSALCLSLFYGVYFLLRKDTHFVIKRIYLVLSLVLALVLPLYTVEYEAQTETEQYWMQLLPEINITSTTSSEGIYSISIKDIVIRPYDDTIARAFMNYLGWNVNPFLLLFAIYISGVLLLFARLMYQFLYFAYSVKRKGLQDVNGIKVLISKEYYLPYSFFNVVCISKEQLNKTGIEKILSRKRAYSTKTLYRLIDSTNNSHIAVDQSFGMAI